LRLKKIKGIKMSTENEYKNLALELNSVSRGRTMGNAEILHRLMVFSEELEDKQKDAVQIVIDAFFLNEATNEGKEISEWFKIHIEALEDMAEWDDMVQDLISNSEKQ
jgi:hypothetical protein